MIQAFAPRLPRGCSWVMLVIAGLVCAGPTASGQQPPKPAPAVAPVPPTPAAPVAANDPAANVADVVLSAKVERFVDPNLKKTLTIFKPIPAGRTMRIVGAGNDLNKMQNMTSGGENQDPVFIKNYIDFFASELTKRDNINALMGQLPGVPANAARGLERAVDALTRPISDARFHNNQSFLTNYTRTLFESSLPKLMDNNYFTRINAMIVLGMAGGNTPIALDFYANQLKQSDQVLWVKHWAARGYTYATQSGRRPLEVSKAIAGADALVGFLNSDPQMPYFTQFRVIEALGSLRVASVNQPAIKLDVASVVAGYLADPKAHLDSRAYAAWTLGMIRVNSDIRPYNFSLAGSEIGDLTVTLAEKIIGEYDAHANNFDRNKDEASTVMALLMFQVIPAIAGEEGISDSGLLRSTHPDASNSRSFLTKLDEKVRAVAREAYDLLRKEAANQKAKRDDLNVKVVELKAFLDTNKPRDRRLVPGGPLFAGRP